jgi:RNA polymerase sigma-70 factor (ECF subfamily)
LEDELETNALAEAVERVVLEMPGRGREVFTLTRDHGFSYAEVAELLHISPQNGRDTWGGRSRSFGARPTRRLGIAAIPRIRESDLDTLFRAGSVGVLPA